MHVEGCHVVRQTLQSAITVGGHGQTSVEILGRPVTLAVLVVRVEHVLPLVSSIGRRVVLLTTVGSHCSELGDGSDPTNAEAAEETEVGT